MYSSTWSYESLRRPQSGTQLSRACPRKLQDKTSSVVIHVAIQPSAHNLPNHNRNLESHGITLLHPGINSIAAVNTTIRIRIPHMYNPLFSL